MEPSRSGTATVTPLLLKPYMFAPGIILFCLHNLGRFELFGGLFYVFLVFPENGYDVQTLGAYKFFKRCRSSPAAVSLFTWQDSSVRWWCCTQNPHGSPILAGPVSAWSDFGNLYRQLDGAPSHWFRFPLFAICYSAWGGACVLCSSYPVQQKSCRRASARRQDFRLQKMTSE